MRLLVVLIAVAACGSVEAPAPMPATPDGAVEVAPPQHAAQAIALIEQSYEASAGVELDGVAVSVHWTAALIPCGDTECGGLSYGCGSIWVADLPPRADQPPLGIPLALAHELGHCARGVLTGDSDGSHADPAWWGDAGYVEIAHQAVRHAGF